MRDLRALLCSLAGAVALTACGGGGGDAGTTSPQSTTITPTSSTPGTSTPATATSTVPAATAYSIGKLVADSNLGGAVHVDANLVNAWGVAFNPAAFVWVSNRGSNTSTLYDGNGVPQSLVVAIPTGAPGPASPTGIVYNGGGAFRVSQNGTTGTSLFIFAGAGGTISGWSPTVNFVSAVPVIDDSSSGAAYTGLAITGTGDRLFAADFRHGTVNVFDSAFARIATAGAFTDQFLPAGYAPYGLQVIGGTVYVAYARPDASGRAAQAGAGLGIIDTYTTTGTFVKRLVNPGGALDAPWGMALAPANFGTFSNALLVANGGDGRINAFDPATGSLLGTLSDASGAPLAIDGLHGIAFGNDLNAQPTNTLFFAAGPGGGAHGLYGRIDTH